MEQGVGVLLSKAKDTVAAAQRAVSERGGTRYAPGAGPALCGQLAGMPGVMHASTCPCIPNDHLQVGLGSSRPEMSAGTMGAAGKMEHAPPGASSG